ncbi:MAG: bifunctional 5,10-methylenetetrahydrofolate dehydrogenase/5,10-methenyltetrahydrofolate cyclohydrolase [Candidatus ainarchaeum sp.]|nr:bifunctional 5,10-methylenetetrahydrofolate dehydrogenase/5,10-methenyltetrahydrofolate cyclohydrolase [Candidatus ainarchaeum sp.]
MAAEIIDGRKIADSLLSALAEEIRGKGLKPKLATVLVGEDPASVSYVAGKIRACERIGVASDAHRLPASVTEGELLKLVGKLNADRSVHGILVQFPLPPHLSEKKVTEAISEEKDVDGFSPRSLGRLFGGDESMPAATPAGVTYLLEAAGVRIAGSHAVVVGRSITVGKPLAAMLLNRDATVTVCHSKTRDLASHTRQADILCVAVGKPGMVSAGMVKKGATVVDVGTTRVDGRLAGDVDFDAVREVAGKITPVPRGIGPMTIASLMRNTVRACERAAAR